MRERLQLTHRRRHRLLRSQTFLKDSLEDPVKKYWHRGCVSEEDVMVKLWKIWRKASECRKAEVEDRQDFACSPQSMHFKKILNQQRSIIILAFYQ